MVKYFLAFLVFLFSSAVVAQQRTIDSLMDLLKKDLPEEKRIDALTELSYTWYDTNDSIAFHYATLALNESRKAGYRLGERYAHTLLGLGYYNRSEYQKAFVSLRQSAAIRVNDRTELAGYNIMLMGSINRDLGYYDSAEHYFELAIKTIGEDGDGYFLGAAYNNLANLKTILWKNQEALSLLARAEQLAGRNIKDSYVMINVWVTYIAVYKNLLDYNKAYYYLEKVCSESHGGINYFNIINCHLQRADLAYRKAEFSAALQHAFDALKVSEIYEFPPLRASVYSKIGQVYLEYSQYELALKYFLEALKITERVGLRHESAEIYQELAWIAKSQRNFKLAHDYLDRSIDILTEIGDQQKLSTCYNYRGLILIDQKQYARALNELEKSLEIREAIGHVIGVSAVLFNIALVYEAQGRLQDALEYQVRAATIEEGINNKQGLAISYSGIAALQMKIGDLTEAEKYLDRAMDLAQLTHSLVLKRNIHKTYAELNGLRGNFKTAYDHQKLFQQLNDSIYSEGSAVKISEMQALYQVEKKEQEIELLNQQKKIQDDQLALQRSEIKTKNIVIISIIIGLMLISVLTIKTYQYSVKIRRAHSEITEQKEEIQAQSEELIEANQTISQINRSLEAKIDERTSALKQAYKELDTFFYRSSHDFRRPLTTFLGLAEVANITVKDQNALELFAKVKETASNLDKMLTKLTSISDVGVQELVYREVLVKEIFDSVCDGFVEQLKINKIRTSCSVNLKSPLMSYPAMIKLVIENLVENSILFCGVRDPWIELSVFDDMQSVIIELKDNGQGIQPQYEDRVFEMYFRGTERSKGNGLGLYIVKKAVEKLYGAISFQSTFGVGTTFRISLPREYEKVMDYRI